MTTLADIREGLRVRLDTIADIKASAYMLPNPTPPCAHIFPSEIEYDLAMARGIDKWMLTVQMLVGNVDSLGAQKKLDARLASSGVDSVKAAIEGDKTLGGIVASARVVSASGYQVYGTGVGRPEALGAEFQVEIIAKG